MDATKIKELIQLVNESGITGLTVEDGDFRVEIRKDNTGAVRLDSAVAMVPAAAPARVKETANDTAGFTPLKAPMTGTFYAAASPTDKPFVAVGNRVNKGQIVCVLEAMKTFNEIEADSSGVVEKILVANAQVVELGQPLFLLRP